MVVSANTEMGGGHSFWDCCRMAKSSFLPRRNKGYFGQKVTKTLFGNSPLLFAPSCKMFATPAFREARNMPTPCDSRCTRSSSLASLATTAKQKCPFGHLCFWRLRGRESHPESQGYACHYDFRHESQNDFVVWTMPSSVRHWRIRSSPSSLYTFPPHRRTWLGITTF